MGLQTLLLATVWMATCLTPITHGANCTDAAIEVCYSYYQAPPSDHFYYGYNREELTTLCNAFDPVDSCVKTFEDNCDVTYKAFLEGQRKRYSYMCNEGFETRVENEACYDDKDVHDNSSSCQQTFLIKLDDVPTGENQEMCRVYNDLLKCLYNVFITHCSREVADMQDKVERLDLEDYMELFECTLIDNSGGSNNQDENNGQETAINIMLLLGSLLYLIRV